MGYIGGLLGSFIAPTKRVAIATLCSCFILSTVVKAIILGFANNGSDHCEGAGGAALYVTWCLINGGLFFGLGTPCSIRSFGGDAPGCFRSHPKVWLAVSVTLQLS